MSIRLTHVAIWTNHLERARSFYETYFNGVRNQKYVNEKKGFSSYFVSFEGGASLEIMQRTDIRDESFTGKEYIGLAHIAFSVGMAKDVDALIERLRKDNYQIVGVPRTTGDGFYEGAFLDPDGNWVEVIAAAD